MSGLQGVTCLLIDDNFFFGDVVALFLSKHGIAVEYAENGKGGLEKYMSAPTKYDFIVIDIEMPVIDGFEVAQRIRNSGYPNAAAIFLIAISGQSPPPGEELINFDRFLHKPFELQKLLLLLEEMSADK